jgi:hypothetical protein
LTLNMLPRCLVSIVFRQRFLNGSQSMIFMSSEPLASMLRFKSGNSIIKKVESRRETRFENEITHLPVEFHSRQLTHPSWPFTFWFKKKNKLDLYCVIETSFQVKFTANSVYRFKWLTTRVENTFFDLNRVLNEL